MANLIGVKFETLEDEDGAYTAHNINECRDFFDADIYERIEKTRETQVITQGHTFATPIWG